MTANGGQEPQEQQDASFTIELSEEQRRGIPINLPNNIGRAFHRHLENYPHYVREVYKRLDTARFSYIVARLSSSRATYLTKNELIEMDMWMQKRGTPKKRERHQINAAKIASNTAETVEVSTNRAFQRYRYRAGKDLRDRLKIYRAKLGSQAITATEGGIGREEDAWAAMEILTTDLHGVARERASLLLSIAFPDDMPYFSQALFRWLSWDVNAGLSQKFQLDRPTCIRLLTDVRAVAKKFKVKAVDVEKVAFVLECEGRIADLKDTRITKYYVKDIYKSLRVETGGFGKVFEVSIETARSVKRCVAIKDIPKTGSVITSRQRFLSEVAISSQLAELSPSHFVKFYGWDEDDRSLYIVMESVQCGDLEKSLNNSADKWTEMAIKTVTQQLLEALRFMHDASIAHRDLKPQNILVVSQPVSHSSDVRIKVADFGVSKRLSDRNTTHLKTSIGSPGYKAPEVVSAWVLETGTHQNHAYSFNVDIWSLGCIIYRMAKGERLFHNDGEVLIQETLRYKVKHIDQFLRPVRRGEPHLGSTGRDFVRKLMVIDAKRRPHVDGAFKEFRNWKLR